MDSKIFKYDFFISYRHGNPDTDVARYLQKLLEHYKIPRDIQKKYGKKRIRRVFRDQEELSVSFDLAEEIRQQLKDSEYLIVICSPNTKDSVWVQREINTFSEVRGREYILPVLIKGEPKDSFPDLLMETEPLAADCRGDSKHKILKKCRNEILRLIAPILHCSYDELKQRHRAYRMHRYAITSIAAATIFLIFGIYIFMQSIQISENYRQKQITQSRFLSQESRDLLEAGDRETALLIAKAALPESEKADDKPLVGDAQVAIENALYLYTLEDPEDYYPQQKLTLNDSLKTIYDFSEEQGVFVCCDQQNTFYFWDLNICSVFRTYQFADNDADPSEVKLGDKGTSFISDDNSVLAYDYINGEIMWNWSNDFYIRKIAVSPDHNTLACITEHHDISLDDTYYKANLIDIETGATVFESDMFVGEPGTDLFLNVLQCEWNPDGTKICITYAEDTLIPAPAESWLYVVDIPTGVIKQLASQKQTPFNAVKFQDTNTLIYLCGLNCHYIADYAYYNSSYTVTSLDCNTGEKNWEIENFTVDGNGPCNIFFTALDQDSDEDVVCIQADTEVIYIQDKTIISEFSYSQTLAGIIRPQDSLKQFHITRDGIIHRTLTSKDFQEGVILNNDYGITSLGLDNIFYVNQTDSGKLLVVPDSGKCLYLFNTQRDTAAISIPDSSNDSYHSFFSSSGKYFVTFDNNEDTSSHNDITTVILRATDTLETLWTYQIESSPFNTIGFFGDNYCYIISDTDIIIYSLKESRIINTYTFETGEKNYHFNIHVLSGDNPMFALCNKDGLFLLTGEPLTPSLILSSKDIQQTVEWQSTSDDGVFDISDYTFSVDNSGQYFAFWSKSTSNTTLDTPIYIYDTDKRDYLNIHNINVLKNTTENNCVFSEDGMIALIYDSNNQIHVLDLQTESETEVLPLDGDSYRMFWLSPNNRYIFLHGRNNMLEVYDRDTQTYTTDSESIPFNITHYSFSDNGNELRIIARTSNAYPHGFIFRPTDEGEYECVSTPGNCLAISDNNILSINDEGLYIFPRRSLQEMLDMADKILNGRELTALEKQRYFIDD